MQIVVSEEDVVELPEALTERSVWVARAGRGAALAEHNLEHGVVTLGWGDWIAHADVSDFGSRASLKRYIEQHGPPRKGDTGNPKYVSNTIWRFCHGISEGDLVVLPLGNAEPTGDWIAVGIATGHAWTDHAQQSGARLRRSVHWLSGAVARAAPKRDLRSSVDESHQTVYRSRVPSAALRVLMLAAHGEDPGPEDGLWQNEWTPAKRRQAWTAFEQAKTHLTPVAVSGDEAGVHSAYDDEIPEGAKTRVHVNRYERDPEARRRCLEHFDYRCQVCKLKFEERYGEVGEGYMHAHHIVPLSEIEDHDSHTVNPIVGLVAVCPNCHAMLHRPKGQALTVPELIEMMDRAGGVAGGD